MKRFSVIFITAAMALFSCNQANVKLNERLAAADSIAINYFKGDGSMDTVVAVKIIRDKKIVEQLAGFISTHPANETMRCGYDGSLHFFKNNTVFQDERCTLHALSFFV
jgi:hypothetical protein